MIKWSDYQGCDDFSTANPDYKPSEASILADKYASSFDDNYQMRVQGFIHGFYGHDHVIRESPQKPYFDAYQQGQAHNS